MTDMLRPKTLFAAGLDTPTWPQVDTRDTRTIRVLAVLPFSHSLSMNPLLFAHIESPSQQ